MRIETDGSSLKKVTVTASCFMGLSHLLYLKEYVKGAVFAAVEVFFLAFILGHIISKYLPSSSFEIISTKKDS